ncbi:diacylglycerol kinase family protein [Paenibacillus dakarensis]|uniref:diacylglycerol kinase family protein n=1 Tax=Paenibacillus dakarensis TaxID=1527293 RepID=UPI0006D58494|nr:diacylglycerol kinase family protein [Paenibacillus dakarensis]
MKPVKPSFRSAFTFAVQGIIHAFKAERNMKIHTAAAIMVIIAGMLFGLTPMRWMFLALAITLVISAELLNTAVEAVVDLVSPDEHPLARIAKDTAAGAVLITALFAVIVGVVVFYDPVLSWISSRF